MKPTVYIETTIPSYLTAWPSKDIYILGQQQMTRKWWDQRDEFDLWASRLVVQECEAGDPLAAAERIKALTGLPLLPESADVAQLATELIVGVPIPEKALPDAFHIAFSAVHRVKYLLTWNCTHLANASLRKKIEAVCKNGGWEAPIICTPDELLLRRTPMRTDEIMLAIRKHRDEYAKRMNYDAFAMLEDLRRMSGMENWKVGKPAEPAAVAKSVDNAAVNAIAAPTA